MVQQIAVGRGMLIFKKPSDKRGVDRPVSWIETSKSVSRRFEFDSDGHFRVKLLKDARPIATKLTDLFLNNFFPSGYPYSVNEGYLRYTQFRALQHFSSAALSVLSTQSLLFAAGLRTTPAQATVVSWVLKDGMEHLGKLICSNLGARMDSEPKRWRILADVLYDFGTGLEILSPLYSHLFLEMAGIGNFAKGMAAVAARATRLPLYSSFAKERNLSDLVAKGEALSTLFNIAGMCIGIQLASTVCSSVHGKMVVAPLLSAMHIYSVIEEMKAVPLNTLNPQRTALLVSCYLKTGNVPSPAGLRGQEELLLPSRLVQHTGHVSIGRALHRAVKPSEFNTWREHFSHEKFILVLRNGKAEMVLQHDATCKDALRGSLVAAIASLIGPEGSAVDILQKAHIMMEQVFPEFLLAVRSRGWHTDRFLDGDGTRFRVSLPS